MNIALMVKPRLCKGLTNVCCDSEDFHKNNDFNLYYLNSVASHFKLSCETYGKLDLEEIVYTIGLCADIPLEITFRHIQDIRVLEVINYINGTKEHSYKMEIEGV